MSSNIRVSILCLTYNHAKYIRQAIESFINQKTTFEYEIIIHDDCSTDNTIEILKEYKEKYPDKIRLLLEDENQYSKGEKNIISIMIPKVKGEYIALCEGDDYWTDKNKLQYQVDILDKNSDYMGCTHNVVVVKENGEPWGRNVQKQFRHEKDIVLNREALKYDCKVSHTACIVLRESLFKNMSNACFDEFQSIKVNGDILVTALILANGSIYHIAKDMAAYRLVVDGNGSWSSRNKKNNIAKKTYLQLENVCVFINKYYKVNLDYSIYCDQLIDTSIRALLRRPNSENWNITKYMLKARNKSYLFFLERAINVLGIKLIKVLSYEK